MAYTINMELRGCHIYKDFWSAEKISNYHALQSLAIVKTSKPLHTHAPIHGYPRVTINFCSKISSLAVE